ncbi:hypothetical protein BGZ70_003314, partial [Mortierella alpina]
MEETQSFRIAGTATDIENIDVDNVNGQKVIYWEDIEQVFPGIRHIRNGSHVVKLLRDLNRVRIMPHCIKHCPGVVLNVILSTTAENFPVDLPIATYLPAPTHSRADTPTSAQTDAALINDPTINPLASFLANLPVKLSANPTIDAPVNRPTNHPPTDRVIEIQQITSPPAEAPISDISPSGVSTTLSPTSISSGVKSASPIALSFMNIVKLASKKASKFDGEVRALELDAKMADMIKLQEVLDAKQEDMIRLRNQTVDRQEEMERLQNQVLDQQEEMKQLQIQALGQLAVLQDRVKAVLTQTYELHECPIPRLFVVLPQNPSRWDRTKFFSNKFRLYFLCECGEHTRSINSKAKIHHIHIAKHDGYDIARPTEFFQRYGPYVLTILKMLKYGISVAGVAIPAISHLVRADAIDQASTHLQKLQDDIELGMDQVIALMDGVSVDESTFIEGFDGDMEKNMALEGDDLRKLDTFLKDKDGNKFLGNLYRTVTDEGHVKWVCIDHYRENYQESMAKDFQRTLDCVGGSLDKSIGRVEVALRSKVLAEQFYSALEKATFVLELDINLDWACATSDMKALEDALKKSKVSILRLYLQQTKFDIKHLSTSA